MLKNYYTGFEGYPEIDFYTYINGEKNRYRNVGRLL